MTALTRNPTNPNPLQPNKFSLSFTRTPNVQFFCQTVSVPGIALSEVPQTTPFVDVYVPGEKAIYDILNITFIVDENLESWREIHDWIRAMTFPHDFTEYQSLATLGRNASGRSVSKPQYSDATLNILTSNNNPNYSFKFYDCFPTSLSNFVMSATDSSDTVITADVTFRYSYYDIKKYT